jgi:hypothetical protein
MVIGRKERINTCSCRGCKRKLQLAEEARHKRRNMARKSSLGVSS